MSYNENYCDCVGYCQACNNTFVFRCPRNELRQLDDWGENHPKICVIKTPLTQGLVSELEKSPETKKKIQAMQGFYESIPKKRKYVRLCDNTDRQKHYLEMKKSKLKKNIDNAEPIILCVHETDQSECKICNVPKWTIEEIKAMTRNTFCEEMGKMKLRMGRDEFLKQQPFGASFFQDYAKKHGFTWDYNLDILMERHREIMPDDVFKNSFENFHKNKMSLKDVATKMGISIVLLKNRLRSLEIPYGNSHRCTSKYNL